MFSVMEGLSKNEGVFSGVVSYKPAQFLYETVLSHILKLRCELLSLQYHLISKIILGRQLGDHFELRAAGIVSYKSSRCLI